MGKEGLFQISLILILLLTSSWVLLQSGTLESQEQKELYQTESGVVYPHGTDPYHFLHLADNILDHGHMADAPSISYSSLRLAPAGRALTDSWYPYVIVGFHKFISLWKPWSLEHTAFYLPVLLGMVSVLLVFFLGKTLFDTMTGFFSALFFSLHPFFVTWNHAGFADTNALNLLFSLAIILCSILYYKQEKIWWAITSLVLIALFFQFWRGAFYIIAVLFFMGTSIILIKKQTIRPSVIISVLALVLVGILTYGDLVYNRLLAPADTVHQYIIELTSISFNELYSTLGGFFGFSISLLALLLVIILMIRKKDVHLGLLLAWLLPLLVAGFLSRRFLFYAAPSFALLLGYSWSYVSDRLSKAVKSYRVHPTIIVILLCLCIPLLFSNSVAYLQHLVPDVNDATVDTLEFIKSETQNNTIIINWVPYGYEIQYFSKRPTIIDAGSLSNKRIHNLSTMYLSSDEEVSVDLMLDMVCGKDQTEFFGDKPSCTDPSAVVLVKQEMLGHMKPMRDLANDDRPIKISKVSPCTQLNSSVLCDNKFRIIGGNATRDSAYPSRFDDYRGEGRKIYTYDNLSDTAFILYDVGERLYSFVISDAYADSLLVRMIAKDDFDHFQLIYETEHPEHNLVYTITWAKNANNTSGDTL